MFEEAKEIVILLNNTIKDELLFLRCCDVLDYFFFRVRRKIVNISLALGAPLADSGSKTENSPKNDTLTFIFFQLGKEAASTRSNYIFPSHD